MQAKPFISVEEVKRANARLMGKLPQISLSREDSDLYARIRKTLPVLKDGPELREKWAKACGR